MVIEILLANTYYSLRPNRAPLPQEFASASTSTLATVTGPSTSTTTITLHQQPSQSSPPQPRALNEAKWLRKCASVPPEGSFFSVSGQVESAGESNERSETRRKVSSSSGENINVAEKKSGEEARSPESESIATKELNWDSAFGQRPELRLRMTSRTIHSSHSCRPSPVYNGAGERSLPEEEKNDSGGSEAFEASQTDGESSLQGPPEDVPREEDGEVGVDRDASGDTSSPGRNEAVKSFAASSISTLDSSDGLDALDMGPGDHHEEFLSVDCSHSPDLHLFPEQASAEESDDSPLPFPVSPATFSPRDRLSTFTNHVVMDEGRTWDPVHPTSASASHSNVGGSWVFMDRARSEDTDRQVREVKRSWHDAIGSVSRSYSPSLPPVSSEASIVGNTRKLQKQQKKKRHSRHMTNPSFSEALSAIPLREPGLSESPQSTIAPHLPLTVVAQEGPRSLVDPLDCQPGAQYVSDVRPNHRVRPSVDGSITFSPALSFTTAEEFGEAPSPPTSGQQLGHSRRRHERTMSAPLLRTTVLPDLDAEAPEDVVTPDPQDTTPMPAKPKQDSVRRREKRYHILQELVRTEHGYLEDLRILMDVYFKALSQISGLDNDRLSMIRRNVRDIYKLHQRICNALEDVQAEAPWIGSDPALAQVEGSTDGDAATLEAIAGIFLDEVPNFHVYGFFCSRHSEAMSVIRSIDSSDLDWVSFEKDCSVQAATRPSASTSKLRRGMSQPASRGAQHHIHFGGVSKLRLQDYAIKPIQRICRYPLLFGQLLKSLDSDEEDSLEDVRAKVSMVLGALKNAAEAVDDAKQRREAEVKSNLIVERLDLQPGLQTAFHSVLGQSVLVGALHVFYHSTDPSFPFAERVKYYGAFLYQSHIVMAKVKKAKNYEPRHWFPLKALDLQDMSEEEGLLPHSFRLSSGRHAVDCGAACLQEKKIWVDRLASLMASAKSDPEVDVVEGSLLCSIPLQEGSATPLDFTQPPSPSLPLFPSAVPSVSPPASPGFGPRSSSSSSLVPTLSRLSQATSTLLGRTPSSQRAAVDLRLSDVFSVECLAARALSNADAFDMRLGRMPSYSRPSRRPSTAVVTGTAPKPKPLNTRRMTYAGGDFIVSDPVQEPPYEDDDESGWKSSLRRASTGPSVRRPKAPAEPDNARNARSLWTGSWTRSRAISLRSVASRASLYAPPPPLPFDGIQGLDAGPATVERYPSTSSRASTHGTPSGESDIPGTPSTQSSSLAPALSDSTEKMSPPLFQVLSESGAACGGPGIFIESIAPDDSTNARPASIHVLHGSPDSLHNGGESKDGFLTSDRSRRNSTETRTSSWREGFRSRRGSTVDLSSRQSSSSSLSRFFAQHGGLSPDLRSAVPRPRSPAEYLPSNSSPIEDVEAEEAGDNSGRSDSESNLSSIHSSHASLSSLADKSHSWRGRNFKTFFARISPLTPLADHGRG